MDAMDQELPSDVSDEDLVSSVSEYVHSIKRAKAPSAKAKADTSARKNSYVWEYFTTLTTDGKILNKCKLCDAVVGHQTSNLGRHLATTHNIIRHHENMTNAVKNRKTRSFVWKYSVKEDNNHARCRFCDKLLYCGDGNTSNLSKHMRRKHRDIIDETPETLDDSEIVVADNVGQEMELVNDGSNAEDDLQNITIFKREVVEPEQNTYNDVDDGNKNSPAADSSVKKERKGASYVWKYCIKINRYLVRCNLCNKQMRFHGTANLITHLQRRHNIMGMETVNAKDLNAQENEENQEEDNNDNSLLKRHHNKHPMSLVWKYFKRIDADSVVCSICKKTLSYQGTSNLQRHLHRMHAIIAQSRANNPTSSSDLDESIVWTHCREINDSQVKCNMCEKVLEKTEGLSAVKAHLINTHSLRPIKNADSSRARNKARVQSSWSLMADESQTSYQGDFGNNFHENTYVDESMNDMEDNRRDDDYLDDLIEEDHEMSNEVAENEDFTEHLQRDNPLSSNSSLDGSYSEQQMERSKTEKYKVIEYTDKRLQRLHEERILTETEYFREKAAFFRMRKYLTALEAKKIRIETSRLKTLTGSNLATPYTISVTMPPEEDLTTTVIN